MEQMYGIKEEVYSNYFKLIESKYFDNPYHNISHAADVAPSALYFIKNPFLEEKLENMETLAVLIACLGHDVAHPGLNNRFLINNRLELATTYNDISVLENMHASLIFKLMKEKHCNADILDCFS